MMKGLKNWAVFLALWLWQLPQNLLGLLLIGILGWVVPIDMKGSKNHHLPSSLLFLHSRMRGGISLGRYIILNGMYTTDFNTWYHERGHSIQSMILGPLYLPVIGLPSLLWAAWWNAGRNVSYYRFYTERWADKLGGVQR
jgi:hypothetical protein